MNRAMNRTWSYLSLCGLMGYGFPPEPLRRMDPQIRFLGADAGSSDPGPYYLGSGTHFVSSRQLDRDLELALLAARRGSLPLILGSAGGAGAGPHLEDVLVRIRRTAASHGLRFRLASIPADLSAETVLQALRDGRIEPCGGAGPLTEEAVLSCQRIVGQMGIEPFRAALDAGADIVVAGRSCDAAIFAAPAMQLGASPAVAFHAAKIAECGALCARPASAADSLLCTLEEDGFLVKPTNPARRCTPESVALHALYEQPSPTQFVEPEGILDLSECRYDAVGDRAVRVRGSRWIPAARASVKLEGAALRGYRAITLAGIRDPAAIGHLDGIEASVVETVKERMGSTFDDLHVALRFLHYGMDAVTSANEPPPPPPREIGLLIEAIAADQTTAQEALALARSTALHQHFDGRKTTAGNLAFPFSPSDLTAGPVYEFAVYHVLREANPEALFPIRWEEIGR